MKHNNIEDFLTPTPPGIDHIFPLWGQCHPLLGMYGLPSGWGLPVTGPQCSHGEMGLQNVVGSIPHQDTCLGCGFYP